MVIFSVRFWPSLIIKMAILGFHLTSPKFRLRNCRFLCVSIQSFIKLGKTFFLISAKKIVPCNITLTSNNLESVCTGLFIHVPQHLLYSYHAPLEIFLYVCRTESKKNPILPCGLGLKVFSFSLFFFR